MLSSPYEYLISLINFFSMILFQRTYRFHRMFVCSFKKSASYQSKHVYCGIPHNNNNSRVVCVCVCVFGGYVKWKNYSSHIRTFLFQYVKLNKFPQSSERLTFTKSQCVHCTVHIGGAGCCGFHFIFNFSFKCFIVALLLNKLKSYIAILSLMMFYFECFTFDFARVCAYACVPYKA